MGYTKVIFCVTALLFGTVTAKADFFDTLNKVANTTDKLSKTAERLSGAPTGQAEGKEAAAEKGGNSAKGAKKHASKGSRKKK